MSGSDVRSAARLAAIGGGTVLTVSAATVGVIAAQGQHAKRVIGPRRAAAPYDDGRYGRSKGPSKRLVMIGDSVAAGLGADRADDTIGAHLARLVADYSRSGVMLSNVAVIGARSKDLDAQVTRALHYRPHVAVIIIGGNDVTHLVRPQASVRYLILAVRRLREAGIQVVLGTTPDLGTIQPFRPPLRWVAHEWSRSLAAAQAVAVVEAGGRAVSLGDLLGPEFSQRHWQLFSADRFHPSTEGYEAVAQALAPAVLAAFSRGEQGEILPELYAPTVEAPLLELAADAAANPGTEIAPAGGGRKLWGIGRRRNLARRVPEHTAEMPVSRPA
ncbi:MAG: SGNH/GDSL hydrolase family protein [Burkholderiaceae bacterium]|nr:MAG: SGNH/GDSL hydrolase family protein [Burkholderiaceae bacterium]